MSNKATVFTNSIGTKTYKVSIEIEFPVYDDNTYEFKEDVSKEKILALLEDEERMEIGEMVLNNFDSAKVL